MNIEQKFAALFRKHAAQVGTALRSIADRMSRLEGQVQAALTQPSSFEAEIAKYPGRRVEYVLNDEVTFDAGDEGLRGEPLTMIVSQDGPFIMTHYPMFLWRPSAPENATNVGRWRPVSTFPLPDQVVDTDIIDLMYEIFDGGNNRGFQNSPRSLVMSRPDNIVPLPCPVVFAPAATIQVFPTYNALTWDGATPPTEGILHCDLIGFRIVNM